MNTLDSPDFIELVIKHLIRDKNSFLKAKELKITADDFGDQNYGIKVYREFVSIALEVNNTPIAQDVFLNAVGVRLEQKKFDNTEVDQISDFIEYIYNTELSSNYIVENLPEFIKRKRGLKLQLKHKDDLDSLSKEYLKLVDDLTITSSCENVSVINPFETIVRRSNVDTIPTGLTRIDAIIQGLGLQEMTLVMGATGGGKSTIATVLVKNAAATGKKVLYLSLEEPAINITQRFYANVLRISYTNLYRGIVEEGFLNRKLQEIDPDLRAALINNLRVVDLRDLTPLSPSVLTDWLEKYCTENDFWPDEIVIDQLEFMKSDTETPSQWEMFQEILLQLFKLSSGLLCNRKAFTLVILHQLTEMRLNYTSKEIAGFKGAMRKCSLVLVLGRKNPTDPLMNIHTLKARNTPNFKLDYIASFEFMDIEDNAPATNNNQQNFVFNNNGSTPVTPSGLVNLPSPPTI